MHMDGDVVYNNSVIVIIASVLAHKALVVPSDSRKYTMKQSVCDCSPSLLLSL